MFAKTISIIILCILSFTLGFMSMIAVSDPVLIQTKQDVKTKDKELKDKEEEIKAWKELYFECWRKM